MNKPQLNYVHVICDTDDPNYDNLVEMNSIGNWIIAK